MDDIGVRSAALDGELGFVGEPADAGPALRLHFLEVFDAGEVGSGVGSSGFGSLLADGVGGSEVVDTGDLLGLGALIGDGEASQEGEESSNEDGLHL